jgi:hypothetical protein
MSERRACQIAKCNRRMFRYKTQRITDDGPYASDLKSWLPSVGGLVTAGFT